MLVLKFKAGANGFGSSSNSAHPSGKGSEDCLAVPEVGAESCKLSDSVIQGREWSNYKIVMDDSSSYTYADMSNSQYTIISQGGQFYLESWEQYNHIPSSTSTYTQGGRPFVVKYGNGRYSRWCYLNTPAHGTQCTTVGYTNTFGVAPHDAGLGGMWVHGWADGGGGFSCGYGSAAESQCTIVHTNRQYDVAHYVCAGCGASHDKIN